MQRVVPSLDHLPRAVFPRAESLQGGTWTHFHSHAWSQLSYAVTGIVEVRTPGGSFVAPPQRALWIPAGIEHTVTTSVRAELHTLYLGASVAPWADSRCRVLEISPLARELIRSVAALPEDFDESGPGGRLVTVLLDQLAVLPEVEFSLPMPADPRLRTICDALQHHPGDKRTLEELSKEAGASGRTIARLFLRQTGLTFREWRLRARLLLSLSALEAGASVTAVALDCGYDSPSAFIAAFGKRFGKTPGEFFS